MKSDVQKPNLNESQQRRIICKKQMIHRITQSTSTQESQNTKSNVISRRVSQIQSTSREYNFNNLKQAASEGIYSPESQGVSIIDQQFKIFNQNSFVQQDKLQIKKQSLFFLQYQHFILQRLACKIKKIRLKTCLQQLRQNIRDQIQAESIIKQKPKSKLKSQKSFSLTHLPLEAIKAASQKAIIGETEEFSSQSSFNADSDIESLDLNLQKNINSNNRRFSKTQQGEEVIISKQFLTQQTGSIQSLLNSAFQPQEKKFNQRKKASTKTHIIHEEDEMNIVNDGAQQGQNKNNSINIRLIVNPSLLKILKKEKTKYDTILKLQQQNYPVQKQKAQQKLSNQEKQVFFEDLRDDIQNDPSLELQEQTLLKYFLLTILIFICLIRIYTLSLIELLLLA